MTLLLLLGDVLMLQELEKDIGVLRMSIYIKVEK